MDKLESIIREFMPDGSVFINEPMKKHTTFRIGGPADILVKPSDIEQIKKAMWGMSETECSVCGSRKRQQCAGSGRGHKRGRDIVT